jgi:hypothetical protein
MNRKKNFNLPCWLVVFAEMVEASVGHWNAIFIRIDGAERKVLSWRCRFSENIEESWFADLKVEISLKIDSDSDDISYVWHANNSNLEIRADAANQRLDLGNILLLRRHYRLLKIEKVEKF